MFAGSDWVWVGIEDKKPLPVKDFKENELRAEVDLLVLDFMLEVMGTEVGLGTGLGE